MASKHQVKQRSSSIGLKLGAIFLLFILSMLSCTCSASMHITAFEYERKFKSLLELGDCPMREIAYNESGVLYYHVEKCPISQAGTVTNSKLPLNDVRNVIIDAPSQIVNYIGLCGGEAASYLGILHRGDCIAVNIASKLVFSEKTLVRAYIHYYRESMDVMEPTEKIKEWLELYYKDKFYLKSRSYGTIEIIFVHFRFKNADEKQRAIPLKVPHSNLMSDYMKNLMHVVKPEKTTVVSLSTSNFGSHFIQPFLSNAYDRAIREVEINEMNIRELFDNINTRKIRPHLDYEFYPFLESDKVAYRSASPLTWEGTSMLEIQIRQALQQARSNVKLCGMREEKVCTRSTSLLVTLKSFLKEFHAGRANWVNLSVDEKNAFTNKHSFRLKSYMNLSGTLSKEIKQLLQNEKRALQNKTNQLPKSNKILNKNKRRNPKRTSKRRNEVVKRAT